MKIRAAVLNAMGAGALRAVEAAEDRDDRARRRRDRARSWCKIAAAGLVPLGPVGDRGRPAAADADGAGARGGGRRRGGRATASTTSRRATTSSWCSSRAAAIACRALRDVRRCASPAPPRTAPARCSPAGAASPPRRAARQPPSRRARRFAEYAVVSRRSCVKVDRELPLDEAALFGCAVLTGVGAVINTAKVPAGTTVAVVGLGGVGLSCDPRRASPAGARRIVAVDLSEEKLALARELGATRHLQRRASPDAVERNPRRPTKAASSTPSRWRARCARSSSPTRSPAAAARPSPPACRRRPRRWRCRR